MLIKRLDKYTPETATLPKILPEDFATDKEVRGKSVGSALWNKMLNWAKEKGCQKLEFACGNEREIAQQFYKNHGAEIYDTNFFRKEL